MIITHSVRRDAITSIAYFLAYSAADKRNNYPKCYFSVCLEELGLIRLQDEYLGLDNVDSTFSSDLPLTWPNAKETLCVCGTLRKNFGCCSIQNIAYSILAVMKWSERTRYFRKYPTAGVRLRHISSMCGYKCVIKFATQCTWFDNVLMAIGYTQYLSYTVLLW